MSYEDKTIKELITIHNDLALLTGDNDIQSWKKAKTGLIAKIEELEGIHQMQQEHKAEEERRIEEEAQRLAAEAEQVDEEDLDDEGEPMETREVSDDEPTRTIREASLEWLCHVVYYEAKTKKSDAENRNISHTDKNARSVGLSYSEIIDRIQAEFPGAKTSVACLRWYAVKVRANEFGYEGYNLVQRRPRAKPSK